MFRTYRLNTVVVPLAALLAVLTQACHRAEAQVKPFKITGGGRAPQGVSLVPFTPRQHTITGLATHLGKHDGLGMFQITGPAPGGNPLKARFSSAPYATFVAANGDKLVCVYGAGGTGEVTLTPVGNGVFTARFVAVFTPVPHLSTGRFNGVTGGWLMIAQSGPFSFISATDTTPFSYTWEGNGSLTFPR